MDNFILKTYRTSIWVCRLISNYFILELFGYEINVFLFSSIVLVAFVEGTAAPEWPIKSPPTEFSRRRRWSHENQKQGWSTVRTVEVFQIEDNSTYCYLLYSVFTSPTVSCWIPYLLYNIVSSSFSLSTLFQDSTYLFFKGGGGRKEERVRNINEREHSLVIFQTHPIQTPTRNQTGGLSLFRMMPNQPSQTHQGNIVSSWCSLDHKLLHLSSLINSNKWG